MALVFQVMTLQQSLKVRGNAMDVLFGFLVAFHAIISALLIIVILLQPGKSGGMGAVFGGGSSASVFGGRGQPPSLARVLECWRRYFRPLHRHRDTGDDLVSLRVLGTPVSTAHQ